jgi:predicted dehydrogenase
VAEPDEYKRERFAAEYDLAEGLVFTTWEEILDEERKKNVVDSVDGMCICTLDETHEEVSFLPSSFHIHLRPANEGA